MLPQCNKWPWAVELQNTQDIHWFLRPSLASLNDYVKWRKQQETRQQMVGYQAGHSQISLKNYLSWKHFAEFIWGQCYYYSIESTKRKEHKIKIPKIIKQQKQGFWEESKSHEQQQSTLYCFPAEGNLEELLSVCMCVSVCVFVK